MFELDQVTYRIGSKTLLHPVDLTFGDGRVHGLIGHNGSGKSTLIKMLARQQAPSAGGIRFGGRDLRAWKVRAFACQVAYLPQQLSAAGALTVRELVGFGRFPWHGTIGRFGAEDREHVEGAIARCGLDSLADRLVDTLSGGERQRAWVAMLLAQNASSLLLDEPISALDLGHQLELLRLIRQLTHERGLVTVIVLHDVNMAARYCDRLVALRGGRLLTSGGPGVIMRAETLERIYGVPMGVTANPFNGAPLSYAH